MHPPVTNPRLHRFAVLSAAVTLALLGVGGLVTSRGVGMAVPDWPNTYGYNMFFFPISRWVGGIFYEHSHRLVASLVGLFTSVLALWVHGKRARPFLRWTGLLLSCGGLVTLFLTPAHWADSLVLSIIGLAAFSAGFFWPRCEPSPRWLRSLGLLAFFIVLAQGVLGGLRVVLFKDEIGIFHATLAQLFFVLVCAFALFTSRWWNWALFNSEGVPAARKISAALTRLFQFAWLLVLVQLILGATMRHQHAGLAIPDFPLAYGKLWPPMDPVAVQHYNQQRIEVTDLNAITPFQIGLQMAHRLLAALILSAVALCAWNARRQLGRKHLVTRLAWCWLLLILIQAFLGAATIWSNKAADVATLHVVAGALSLALGAMLILVAYRAPSGREVLECACPLALFEGQSTIDSARGLARSKTLSRHRASAASGLQ